MDMQQLMQLAGMLQNSGNPMAMLQQMAGNNPMMAQALKMAQGGNPQEIVMNLAKERGIDVNQLTQLAGQFGLKL